MVFKGAEFLLGNVLMAPERFLASLEKERCEKTRLFYSSELINKPEFSA